MGYIGIEPTEYYLQRVERDFAIVYREAMERKQWVPKFGKTATSVEDVRQLFTENPKKIWWFAWEINGSQISTGKKLSHRACARATDLVTRGEAESRRIGRFKIYRLKFEELPE